MNPLHRARRVGYTSVLCAMLLRLFAAGLPQKLYLQHLQPNIDAFFQKQETGQDVRFSSSIDTFIPDFMESPPPSLPPVTEVPLPTFTGEEAVAPLPPLPHLLPVPPIDQREGRPSYSPGPQQGEGKRVEEKTERPPAQGHEGISQASLLLFPQGTRIALINAHCLPGTVLCL